MRAAKAQESLAAAGWAGGGRDWGARRNCPRNSVYLSGFPHFWPVRKHQVEHLWHCPKGVMGALHIGWMLFHVGLPTSLGALSSSLGHLSWWEQHQVY